jgi:hypothetical protein
MTGVACACVVSGTLLCPIEAPNASNAPLPSGSKKNGQRRLRADAAIRWTFSEQSLDCLSWFNGSSFRKYREGDLPCLKRYEEAYTLLEVNLPGLLHGIQAGDGLKSC